MVEVKYLLYKGQKIRITKWSDGLWRFDDGTVAAISEDTNSVDTTNRPGVGFFSWRSWWPGYQELTDAATPHDYLYSSLAAQRAYTREEADTYLQSLIVKESEQDGDGWIFYLAKPFRWLSRKFGGQFWETEGTND